MKTTIKVIAIAIMALNISCKKNTPASAASCTDGATKEYDLAIKAWTADITNKTKCEAVLSISQKFLNCPGVTTIDKKQYQELLDSKPCNGI